MMISHKTKITTVRHWTLKHTTYDEDTDAIVNVGVGRKGVMKCTSELPSLLYDYTENLIFLLINQY